MMLVGPTCLARPKFPSAWKMLALALRLASKVAVLDELETKSLAKFSYSLHEFLSPRQMPVLTICFEIEKPVPAGERGEGGKVGAVYYALLLLLFFQKKKKPTPITRSTRTLCKKSREDELFVAGHHDR